MNKEQARVLKRIEVQTAMLNDNTPGVLLRLFMNDPKTGEMKPSELLAMEAADALSFAQGLLASAQKALGKEGDAEAPKH